MCGDGAPLIILGDHAPSGTYLLRIAVAEPLSVVFGRFRAGQPLTLPEGDYLYVGSAMAETGSSSLARRLVRHATRSGDLPPHPLRAELIAHFSSAGLGSGDLRPRHGKSLFWHIDYLLDRPEASLTHVLAIRSRRRLEARLAGLLQARPETGVLATGLGASDATQITHLFTVQPAPAWWPNLVTAIRRTLL
jgi:Uri superfamily endonuclease